MHVESFIYNYNTCVPITNTLSGSLFPFVITVGMVPGCFHAASYSVTLFALFTPWK